MRIFCNDDATFRPFEFSRAFSLSFSCSFKNNNNNKQVVDLTTCVATAVVKRDKPIFCQFYTIVSTYFGHKRATRVLFAHIKGPSFLGGLSPHHRGELLDCCRICVKMGSSAVGDTTP
jgi:hypothetical protein